MPADAKPLFRPEAVRPRLAGFRLPDRVAGVREALVRWADDIASGRIDAHKEREVLPDFLTDFFLRLLGYAGPVGGGARHTFSRERHVEVGGKYADAVIGDFRPGEARYVVAVEGKGPRDPLDRPFAGRAMSAVDQGYRYAINLPCDWVVVTNLREVRLYHKGSDQQTYERFDTERLAHDDAALRRFVFLLGAERVVPEQGRCHFYDLLEESQRIGKEVTKQYYVHYADLRQDTFGRLRAANPGVPPAELLAATQKVLDRVLFCAFCEDRGLLPAESVARAYAHDDPYNPRPVWENFRGLFRAIDAGSERLGIPRYNGGLFAPDERLDRLTVPDEACIAFRDLAAYDYRPPQQVAGEEAEPTPPGVRERGRLVDVDILGHIFEQSITDLEKLRGSIDAANGDGTAAAATPEQHKARRKKEGAFYTPPFITRYIVAEALGGVLRERLEGLRRRHEAEAEGTARAALADPGVYDLAALNRPQRAALVRFWEAWQAELGTVRLLDPACGSGAFLIEAFDQLHAAYEQANDRLAELRGHRTLFDLDRQILQHNLYGVDLNGEAVEICRLSLWIKTARRGKELTSLDHTIRVGNSVVDDPAAAGPRAFDWRAAFPEAFTAGGFDVVVGNPPYVRQEWIGPIKPHLEKHYAAYHGMADLYVYFYELGLRVLRPGGRLSLVVTNKWLKAGYAEPLRRHLAENAWVESLVDFGHAKQIFQDADVFPCILVAQKPAPETQPPQPRVAVIPREQLRIDDLGRQVADTAHAVARQTFGPAEWRLEPAGAAQLLAKLARQSKPLCEFIGAPPAAGFATGCNDAFVIDSPTREQILTEDPGSGDIIKRYLRGQDLERWRSAWSGDWIIFTRRGIDIDRYPGVRAHLSKFREQLEPKPATWSGESWPGRKPGSYAWYEIQDSADYWRDLEKPKIIYPDITWRSTFSADPEGTFFSKTVYFLSTDDPWVLAVLNSPVAWWYSWRTAQHGKDDALRFFKPFVERFPMPRSTDQRAETCRSAVRRCGEIASVRQAQT